MAHSIQSLEPLKPKTGQVTAKGGAVFMVDLDVWKIRGETDTVSIDFTQFSSLNQELVSSLKSTLAWFAEKYSTAHLQNIYTRMRHFDRHLESTQSTAIKRITVESVINYKASLDEATAYYLATLKLLLTKWYRLGYPGIDADVIALFKEVRIPGNSKGVAVLTMDPVTGPFTSIELEAIQSATNTAYANGVMTEPTFLLTWLFMALGQRPSQYAALKVCDIVATPLADGTFSYVLNMPRAKKRNAGHRATLKQRDLIPQIGKPLLDYARRVTLSFQGVLEVPSQAPMFPQMRHTHTTGSFAYHQTGARIGQILTAAIEALSVSSERTGEVLNISPVRFRRTFATRAAQQGHGELVIAELLDHTDTQNVGVYVASVPEIAARIDKATAMQLAPLAQAFQGMLIDGESQATRGSDPSSRIVDLRIDKSRPMGSCGQFSFCGFNAPIACYSCKSFQPWLDGPHEAVLEMLLERRERLLKNADQTIAAINDRTILAVAEVIELCQVARMRDDR